MATLYLRELDDEDQVSSDQIRQEQVPLGELLSVHPGVVVSNGQLTGIQRAERHSLVLSLTTNRIIPIHRAARCADSDQLLIPNVVVGDTTHELASPKLFRISPGDDLPTVWIPCSEVWRFFYGTSSILATAIVSSDALDADLARFVVPGSWAMDENNRTADLTIRSKFGKADAWLLAMLHSTPMQAALKQLGQAAKRRAVAAMRGERVDLDLPIPLYAPTRLDLLAVPFQGPQGSALFVLKILASHQHLPFDRLTYRYLRKPEITGSDTALAPDSSGGSGLLFDPELAAIELSGKATPSRRYLIRNIPVDRMAERYPGFDFDQIGMDEAAMSVRGSAHVGGKKHAPRTPATRTVRGARGGGDKATAQVNLVAHSSSESRPQRTVTPSGVMSSTLDVLDALAVTMHGQWQPIVVTPRQATLWGCSFNVPDPEFAEPRVAIRGVRKDKNVSRSRRWCYLDGNKTVPRLILIAEVHGSHGTSYVLDCLRRPDEAYGLLLFQGAHQGPLSDRDLMQILVGCVHRRRATPAAHARELPNVWFDDERHYLTASVERRAKRIRHKLSTLMAKRAGDGKPS